MPFLSFLLPAVALAGAASADVAPAEPVVVRLDPDASAEERAADLADSGLTVVDRLPGSDFVLAVPDRPTTDAGGAIEEVAPLVTYRAMGVPNDPGYQYQWHLKAIGAAAAWDVTDGTGAVVAVIDSGVAYSDVGGFLRAPDLAGTTFAPGWDFVDTDAYPNDELGHGTHVASTIAATTNNGIGVAGAAPGVTIMPLRVLDESGSGSDWDTAQALRFAADNGADVANLSLGSTEPSSVMADAIVYARAKGVTVVAAAGNQGTSSVSYPAAFPGVIAVGAVRQDLTRSAYSNYGPALDIVAPGGDTSVDQDGDGYRDGILQESFTTSPTAFCYCFLQGTSMATPQVSAVAAMLAARGFTDPDAIEQVLISTTKDLGATGRDDVYGHGLVQAQLAVLAPLASGETSGPGGTTTAPEEPTASDPVDSGPVDADPVDADPVHADPVDADPVDSPTTVTVRGIENACPSATTPTPPFTDLGGSVHAAAVGCVAWWEVASGRTATTFDPGGSMTRAQLASFVARMLDESGLALPSSPPDAFTDDDDSVHELRINQLAALGVVKGRTATTYAPRATVTRAEMATFLVRAHDLVATPLPAGPDRFTDDDGSTHEANIDKVAAAGLAAGTSPTTFSPTDPVLRGQMATFLARTLDLFVDTGAVTPR